MKICGLPSGDEANLLGFALLGSFPRGIGTLPETDVSWVITVIEPVLKAEKWERVDSIYRRSLFRFAFSILVHPVRGLRSLLLQKIDTRVPGIHLMRLRLHRHLPEVDSLETHSHSWSQFLCYLAGTGTLVIRGKEYTVAPGTVAWIPKRHRHGFREALGRRPLCMAFDVRLSPSPTLRLGRLNHAELAEIRRRLAELSRLKNPSAMESRLQAASLALAILDILFRVLGFLPRHAAPVPAFIKKFRKLAAQPDLAHTSIAELADLVGYQPDYLNRAFKHATGLTLRQERDAVRLTLAQDNLKVATSIGEAAERSGFDDVNYFSRWFRRHTGKTPSTFRGEHAPNLHKK